MSYEISFEGLTVSPSLLVFYPCRGRIIFSMMLPFSHAGMMHLLLHFQMDFHVFFTAKPTTF